jgi:hypothetical protein
MPTLFLRMSIDYDPSSTEEMSEEELYETDSEAELKLQQIESVLATDNLKKRQAVLDRLGIPWEQFRSWIESIETIEMEAGRSCAVRIRARSVRSVNKMKALLGEPLLEPSDEDSPPPRLHQVAALPLITSDIPAPTPQNGIVPRIRLLRAEERAELKTLLRETVIPKRLGKGRNRSFSADTRENVVRIVQLLTKDRLVSWFLRQHGLHYNLVKTWEAGLCAEEGRTSPKRSTRK